MRRDLVANVSHELRTPITALQAVLENLVDGVEAPDPETLSTMLAQVERLGRLVQQLLDLSRLESGGVPLDRRVFEVAPMLELAVRETRLHAGPVRLSVSVATRPTSPSTPTRSGCTRSSPTSSRTRCGTRRPTAWSPSALAPTVDAVRIEVTDDGPGIPPAEATRVFERFYRADSARSSDHGGAGLGLAIARWIVDLHDGDVHVERHEPHGAPDGRHDPRSVARATKIERRSATRRERAPVTRLDPQGHDPKGR